MKKHLLKRNYSISSRTDSEEDGSKKQENTFKRYIRPLS